VFRRHCEINHSSFNLSVECLQVALENSRPATTWLANRKEVRWMVEHTGECCICGKIGKLTFEHVPPKAAFNDRGVFQAKMEE